MSWHTKGRRVVLSLLGLPGGASWLPDICDVKHHMNYLD